MATVSQDADSSPAATSQVEPLIALFGAVLLLSTVPTVTKYVFQHSNVDPLGMALIRVMTGFLFLFAITFVQDRRGLGALTAGDVLRLTLLGGLGVGSYVIAACGLRLTTVTHYILIYSLLSPITALFSVLVRKSSGGYLKMFGIVISLFGGVIAMSERLEHFKAEFGLGDLLILLFTVMMAAHLVWSANIVKRYGAMTANTVMFGSSGLLLLFGASIWTSPPVGHLSTTIVVSVLYIGVATASVFLLRFRALRTISPATVAVYQNLTPVCGIMFARFYLGEHIRTSTIVGGTIILIGAEVVRRASQSHLRAAIPAPSIISPAPSVPGFPTSS